MGDGLRDFSKFPCRGAASEPQPHGTGFRHLYITPVPGQAGPLRVRWACKAQLGSNPPRLGPAQAAQQRACVQGCLWLSSDFAILIFTPDKAPGLSGYCREEGSF